MMNGQDRAAVFSRTGVPTPAQAAAELERQRAYARDYQRTRRARLRALAAQAAPVREVAVA